MCIICIELKKGSLMPWEAARNLKEMSESLDSEHVEEVIDLIATIQHQNNFCKYCECDPCDCDWGNSNNSLT